MLVCGFSGSIFGTTIWDNGGPGLVTGLASDFNFPAGFQVGDNFALSGAKTARQIQWWGVYSMAPTDNFTIRFFNITAGVPAAVPFFSYSAGDVGRTDTGLSIAGLYEIYSYTAAIPDVNLGPGTYLLSIVNNTSAVPNDIWYWDSTYPQTVASGAWYRQIDGQPWVAQDEGFAFNITDDRTVSDTGTSALLLGCSLAALYLVRRRAVVPHDARLG